MRILVYEYFSGGGRAGHPLPESMAREGAAMLSAILADLAALRQHRIVTTFDSRARVCVPGGVEAVTVDGTPAGVLARAIHAADAVWIVAPEAGGHLERLAAEVQNAGRLLLGPSAAAIRRVADKGALMGTLRATGVSVPETRALQSGADAAALAAGLGYPVVIKPSRGAGCEGVGLAGGPAELPRVLAAARRAAGGEGGMLLLQEWVPGTAASATLLCDGRDAVALALNAQRVTPGVPFVYAGGDTPLQHPLAEQASGAAVAACRLVPGLRGLVGVDLVLTGSGAVVIEINPRVTTAYLGVRASVDANVAALALDACSGALPLIPPRAARHVRFTAAGEVATSEPAA